MYINPEHIQNIKDIYSNSDNYSDKELYNEIRHYHSIYSIDIKLKEITSLTNSWERLNKDVPKIYYRDEMILYLKYLHETLEVKSKDFTTQKIKSSTPSAVNIYNTNTNNINISITWETVVENINNSNEYDETEQEEILSKINELQKILETKSSKKTKWSKVKDIMKWLIDKGIDAGIALIPTLMTFYNK